MKHITRKELEGYTKRLKRDMTSKMSRSDMDCLTESFAVDNDGEITKYSLIAYLVECVGYDDVLDEMVEYFEIEFDLECDLDYGFNEAAHIL